MRMLTFTQFLSALTRKKVTFDHDNSKLARVLTTLDLTALGIGSTLGVGVYVLAGEVAKTYAGPSVVISFFIAALASVFAGLCYAEFGARVPKAGSAYVYSYVTIGEFVAFIIGWNLILEYIIGSASVVKGLFTYLDALVYHKISDFLQENLPMNAPALAPFPDLFSLGVVLLFSLALALGARESSFVNNIFTMVNLSVVVFAIVSGLWKADISNWSIPESEVPEGYGTGGFAPYGFAGIIKGAATCFYGFIGFDCIATAGEEAKTPQKSIPIAIIVSLSVIFLAYFGMSTVLTMMLPYYLQDTNAPLPHVYDVVGWPVAKYIVTAGAICGLFSSLLGAMFPLPRVIYSMASDGLMFEIIGRVHPRFQTPVLGTLIAGCFTGVLACIFELSQLFTMMSIGTLSAYSIVAACVIILRYTEEEPSDEKFKYEEEVNVRTVAAQLFNYKLEKPNKVSTFIVTCASASYCVCCFGPTSMLTLFEKDLLNGEPWVVSICAISTTLLIMLLIIISFQPQSSKSLTFAVPFVPWLPGISIFINLYLMTTLDTATWIRFVVWIAVGLLIYFTYGIWNSKELSVQQRQSGLTGSTTVSNENSKTILRTASGV
ncbi:hypothetical protein PPYR_11368 [Photinus pyralis]|nr:hypothetical protein PPYR_11368 [Photinus pyralis]